MNIFNECEEMCWSYYERRSRDGVGGYGEAQLCAPTNGGQQLWRRAMDRHRNHANLLQTGDIFRSLLCVDLVSLDNTPANIQHALHNKHNSSVLYVFVGRGPSVPIRQIDKQEAAHNL